MWQTYLLFLFFYIITINSSSSQLIKIYTTTKEHLGFNLRQASFNATKDAAAIVATVNPGVKHQKILGFGGTFSDATCINLNKLTKEARAEALQALFGTNGIGLNLCRVPIGANEYSTRLYSLDDHDGDTTLKQFALQQEDLVHKIPIIKEAETLRKGSLKLIASPWTAPVWMKSQKRWRGYNRLDMKYGQVYAEYLRKALDAYKEKGVKWWGLTTGTFPYHGFKNSNPSSMGWIPDEQSKWIAENLGPVIRNSSQKDIKILGHDDSRESFPYFSPEYVSRPKTLKYLDGLITDWSLGPQNHPGILDFAKSDKKELFIISTNIWYNKVSKVLNNWDKAFGNLRTIYGKMIDGDLGWVDYNLVLNTHGGPSHANLPSDAPLIISDDGKSFIKTPAYYVLGHFSKYIIPGSVRIDVTLTPETRLVGAIGFLRPDNVTVVCVFNGNPTATRIQLAQGKKLSQSIEIPGASFHSLLYV